MKIAIFGLTGKTGRELVKQGIELGHEIIAFARTPSKLDDLKHKNLSMIQGDLPIMSLWKKLWKTFKPSFPHWVHQP